MAKIAKMSLRRAKAMLATYRRCVLNMYASRFVQWASAGGDYIVARGFYPRGDNVAAYVKIIGEPAEFYERHGEWSGLAAEELLACGSNLPVCDYSVLNVKSVLHDGRVRFAQNGTTLYVDYFHEYYAPPFNGDTVEDLKSFFAAKSVVLADDIDIGGCESCDFGSAYGYRLIVRGASKNLPVGADACLAFVAI